jgi:hypothetical protein
LLLVIIAMLLGEIYGIWNSHVANGEIRQHWDAIAAAGVEGRAEELSGRFLHVERDATDGPAKVFIAPRTVP